MYSKHLSKASLAHTGPQTLSSHSNMFNFIFFKYILFSFTQTTSLNMVQYSHVNFCWIFGGVQTDTF